MSEEGINQQPNQGPDKDSSEYLQQYHESDGTLRPNNEALIAKRNEYIETAIGVVLARSKKEVLDCSPLRFVNMVEAELREKSSVGQNQWNQEAFEREYTH